MPIPASGRSIGVRIRPFAIAKYELSVAEWQACVDAGGCSYKPVAAGYGSGKAADDQSELG